MSGGRVLVASLALTAAATALVLLAGGSSRVSLVQRSPLARVQYAISKGNLDLARAQTDIHSALGEGKAHVTMLTGIGGWGSGEEDDNGKSWEVSMHVDPGCQEILDLRAEGNPGWKRYPTIKCDPNKQKNPYMWPYDAPGQVWLHDSKDSTKVEDQWPYEMSNLHDYVHGATPTPAWADGIWHGDNPDRRLATDGYATAEKAPVQSLAMEAADQYVDDGEPSEAAEETKLHYQQDLSRFFNGEANTPLAAPGRAQALAMKPWDLDDTDWRQSHQEKQEFLRDQWQRQFSGEESLTRPMV